MKAAIIVKIALLVILSYCWQGYDNDYFLMPYREGDKWGLCDTLGKVKVQPQYDGFVDMIVDESSRQCFYFVKKNGSTILIDHNNVQQLKGYDSVNPVLYRMYKGGKTGMYSYRPGSAYHKTTGRFEIWAEPVYNSIEPVVEHRTYIVDRNGKKGLLYTNYEGASIVLQPEYDKIVFEKPYYIGYKGSVAAGKYYDEIYAYSGDMDIAPAPSSDADKAAAKEALKKKDDQERKKIVENLTRDISPEELKKIIPFEITPINKYVKFRENGKQGYAHFSYSLSGPTKKLIRNEVMPAVYDSISEYYTFYFLFNKEGKYGFSIGKKMVLEPIYDDIKFYKAGVNELLVKTGKKYAVYKLGDNKFLTEFIYDGFTFIPKGEYVAHTILQKGKKKILFDKEKASDEYDELVPLDKLLPEGRGKVPHSSFLKCRNGNKYGVLWEGMVYVPVAYDDIYVDPDGLLITVIDGNKGTYGEKGRTDIPSLYKSVEQFKRLSIGNKPYSLFKVKNRNGVVFYTDNKGREFYKP